VRWRQEFSGRFAKRNRPARQDMTAAARIIASNHLKRRGQKGYKHWLGNLAMDLTNALILLRAHNEPVPRPLRLPTSAEVDGAERRLDIIFHPDFRRYLLEGSDVVCGVLEPVTITRPESHTDLFKVVEMAWMGYGVPRELLPICEDNADFYCMNSSGEVVFWSHNGWSSEKWPSLADWIEQVWLLGH
jgi:hypothetical protein